MWNTPSPARGAVFVLAHLALWSAGYGCDEPKRPTMQKPQDPGPDAGSGDRCEKPRPYYYDADGDGYGNLNDALVTCLKPPGFVNRPIDCDDRNALVHSLAEELCDGLDNDCNDVVDDGENLECASDTSFPCQTSCGTTGTRYCSKQCKVSECMPPVELCNYTDDNCDGVVDEQRAALSDESVSLATRLDHLLPDGARWLAVSGDEVRSLDFFGRTTNSAVDLGIGTKIAAARVIGETVVLAWLTESKVDETCPSTSLVAQAFRKNSWAPIMAPQVLKTDDACRSMTTHMVSLLGGELLFVIATRDETSETTELSTIVSSNVGVARTATSLTTLHGADVSDAFRLVATPNAPTPAALVYLDPDASSAATIRLATLTHDGALTAPAITLDTGDVSRPALAYDGQTTLLAAYAVARELGVRKVSLTSSGEVGSRRPLLTGNSIPVPALAFHGGRWFVGAIAEPCDPDIPTCALGSSLHVRVLSNDELQDEAAVTKPIPVLRGGRHHLSVNTATALFVVGNDSVNHAYLWACSGSGQDALEPM